MPEITIYGIPNCDTTKLAIKWLKNAGLTFGFHDYKKHGITASKLSSWAAIKGWEYLLNKKGSTWRGIEPAIQQRTNNKLAAIQLMREHQSLIKRPIAEINGTLIIGFNESFYLEAIQKQK